MLDRDHIWGEKRRRGRREKMILSQMTVEEYVCVLMRGGSFFD